MLFATFSWAGMCCLHSQQAHQPNDLNCQFRHMKPTLCNWTDLIKSHQSYLDTSSWTFLSFFVRWQCRWTSSARRNYVLRQVSTTKFGQKVIEPCSCSACHVVVLLPNFIPGYSASGAAVILSDLQILVVPMTIDDSSESKENIRTSIYLLVTVAADQEAFQGPIKGWIPIPRRFPCSSHINNINIGTVWEWVLSPGDLPPYHESGHGTLVFLRAPHVCYYACLCAHDITCHRVSTKHRSTCCTPLLSNQKKTAMLELQLQQGFGTFYKTYNLFTVTNFNGINR